MMHEREKSDTAVVAVKPANKAGATAAEPEEPRAGTKRNASGQSTHRTLSRVRVTQARSTAYGRPQGKGRGEVHRTPPPSQHRSVPGSVPCAQARAAPGVDDLTWSTYTADLEEILIDLHARVHRGAYRALPSRRTYIPKADGRQRPLSYQPGPVDGNLGAAVCPRPALHPQDAPGGVPGRGIAFQAERGRVRCY